MSKTLWQQSIKDARSLRQRCPLITKNIVLATFNFGQGANFQSCLLAIDSKTGAPLWNFETNHYLNEPVVDAAGFIYQSCFDGSVYKFDINGKICWRTQASTTNTWSGCLVNNLFIYSEIAGQAKFTRGLECNTGKVLWEYEHGGHSYSLASDNHKYVVHACIAGGFDSKTISLLCLEANTGKLVWQNKFDHFIFRPSIHNNQIFLGSRESCLIIDLLSGDIITTKILKKNETVELAPLVTDEGIVFISNIGKIYLCDWLADQFIEKWSLDISQEIKAKPIIHHGNLFLIAENGNLINIDLTTGSIITSTQISNFTEGFGLANIDNDLIISASRNCVRMKIE